jgi:hypothetical protein
MDTLSSHDVWTFLPGENQAKKVRCCKVREIHDGSANGHLVSNYRELARKIAELQFRNPEFVLLFRGQPDDYPTTKKGSSIKPSLFRPEFGKIASPDSVEVARRYEALKVAEKALLTQWKRQGLANIQKLSRYRILRWSILQHYEMCSTPLLDVTHSLRIACSFASGGDHDSDAYLMVLAIPQISGSITVSAESELQILRMASICPPSAERPHLQEAYLLGDYPDLTEFDQKMEVAAYEVDFGRRLIAKFRFIPSKFWGTDAVFPRVPMDALTPRDEDPVLKIAMIIQQSVKSFNIHN